MNWIFPYTSSVSTDQTFDSLLKNILAFREIKTEIEIKRFLDPNAYSPASPFELSGMEKAVEILLKAIKNQIPILVWGDYDVDGQTSTALLYSTIINLGGQVGFHVPVRGKETHGVSSDVLRDYIDLGYKILLTCDTGISELSGIGYAKSMGMQIVVSDHHQLPEQLPPADALINPRLLTNSHPLANLSGVGVAYKLAEALLQSTPSPISALTLLDLAALGTVADLVPLIADNRYLVQTGLKTLRNTPRIGLQALFELAELDVSNLNEEHIAFSIAPRLNALGRLEDANKAVELLTTGDLSRARILAIEIEGLNTRRKFLCDQVYEAAQNLILADRSKMDAGIIVLAHPDWPIGVLGIVASRLVSSYNRPAILISSSQAGPASGSARSIEGFNITAALAMNKDFLINFGGHPMAAGFSILPEKINEFIRAINYRFPSAIPARQEKRLLVDAELPLPMLSLELIQKLEMLAPFGPGNPQPLFVARDLNLVGCSEVGKNKEHLLLTIRGSTNETYKVISWQGAKRKLPEGQFELAYTCRSNNYLGKPGLQISLVDIRDQVKSDVGVTKTSVVVSVVDMRNSTPSQILDFYKTMQNEQALIWAEALRVSNLVSQNRLHLSLSPILAVWTIPPGPNELIQALKTVQPATIFLFGNDPGLDKMTPFLSRLAGLLKYALEYYQGSCDLRDLAAEMAHRIETVHCGLVCLRALGHFQIIENNLILSLSTPGIINTADLPREEARLKTYLEETSAYRKYYLTADKSFLVTV